ncbi:hypothetical protein GCM10027418_05670 [Mariniluteicoccus endophyticus]
MDKNGFGFLHLFDGPQPSHREKYQQLTVGTDMTWEELADMAISVALEEQPLVQDNLNWCYRSKLRRYVRRTGETVGIFDFVVIVDPSYMSIVTTYPGPDCRPEKKI